ncbi:MAG TPA: hypothetical protein VJ964_06555 [Balneolaceae bacterium]|nr:hypothetical protein [Balneolaceae bacterium]
MTGCASSSNSNNEKHSFTNLVTVEKPGSTKHNPSKVYVDSVKQITIDQKPALLVSGTFPDACTKLEEVTHRISDDSLSLNLKAWRNPDELCAQVLTPFSFIYDSLTKKELSSHSSVYINKTAYHY